MKIMKIIILIFTLFSNLVFSAEVETVKKVFESIQRKADLFDSSFVEFYSDKAVIEYRRFYPNGKSKVMTLSGVQYKNLIKKGMPLAKAKGDKSEYRDVTYTKIKDGIVVKATRWSVLKKYGTPYEAHFSMVEGKVMIVRELSESKP